MRALFICSQNRFRSPTAEAIFSSHEGVETLSAGLNNDATTPLTGDLIDWAKIIFVMEKSHRNRLNRKFRSLLRTKHVVTLGIPDDYEYMEPELVNLLRHRVAPHLRRRREDTGV